VGEITTLIIGEGLTLGQVDVTGSFSVLTYDKYGNAVVTERDGAVVRAVFTSSVDVADNWEAGGLLCTGTRPILLLIHLLLLLLVLILLLLLLLLLLLVPPPPPPPPLPPPPPSPPPLFFLLLLSSSSPHLLFST
jgi:hypothetical protein